MTRPLRLALVGIGKIARDQHLPAIAADPGLELVAAVSRNAGVPGVANFTDLAALRASGLGIDAVSICTPPLGRHAIAAAALAAGWHVMLEKPPGASLGEVRDLVDRARGRTLFASWHSREAAGVAAAAAWVRSRAITSVQVDWREDIRRWHPGQAWILAAGGLGVFDPGINALSILTAVLPGRLRLAGAALVVPAGRDAPIAATLQLVTANGSPVAASFDFREAADERWDIAFAAASGSAVLTDGGGRLVVDGVEQLPSFDDPGEYPRLYRRFAGLVAAGGSDCDLAPLELVADAFLIGARSVAAPFEF